MTILNLPIPGVRALLEAEYPSLVDGDYVLARFPGALMEIWLQTSSGSGTFDWTTIYDPWNDGKGQWAAGSVEAPTSGEWYGTGTLLRYKSPSVNADLADLRAAQVAAATYEPFWVRVEYTGPVLTNINIHFAIPLTVVRQYPRPDGKGWGNGSRIYPSPEAPIVGGFE